MRVNTAQYETAIIYIQVVVVRRQHLLTGYTFMKKLLLAPQNINGVHVSRVERFNGYRKYTGCKKGSTGDQNGY